LRYFNTFEDGQREPSSKSIAIATMESSLTLIDGLDNGRNGKIDFPEV
jgi:hypothetical protein